jgi:YgiT-type zinc finger domain-containing protein
MIPFNKCPICGGDVVEKMVEKVLMGGKNTAVVKVEAEVCLKCGERIFSKETIKRFEQIRLKLENQETDGFLPMGQSYQVV